MGIHITMLGRTLDGPTEAEVKKHTSFGIWDLEITSRLISTVTDNMYTALERGSLRVRWSHRTCASISTQKSPGSQH